ncbi:MAG: chromosomal replication initiator protein DnaA [Ruminococcus flavefaciens]|nr:chromosomal replication initiator protein DnaA [Ruminococcus flavefaciens]MCM1360533.1 chromosomal replication initiator protein DnaA [Clostridiales bacterium]MCM1435868.1 chromosomal replication initiator protein DnaA [Ruminococcus flavefaciens]
MNSFEDVFDNVKKYCLENDKIPEIGITTWIDQMKPASFNGTDAVFGIQTDFQKNIVMTKYGDILKDAFLNVLGFNVNIVINVDSDEPEKVKVPTDDELEQKHAELEKSYKFANYDYTFDTFIEGRSNEFALACSKSVAKNCGERAVPDYNPLFIYGPSGMGKTHLITAIANEVRKKQPSFNITYVTSETFGNDLVNALNTSHISNFQDKYRNADILLIDDIQFFAGKERMQEEFFHTFYKLHQEGRQIVITSDKPPKELLTLEERLRTRFEGGLIADISAPDYETRLAIINRKSELLELKMPSEVAEFMANRLKSNIRQLEGAVVRLKALNHFAGSPITISMAQSVIRDVLTDEQPIPITVEKIISEVSTVYGVSPDDIRSNKRSAQISIARKVAIFVVREITQMPLASIGTEFGGRDHSTIVYSVTSVSEAMEKDANLKSLVEDIIKNIRDKSKI